jgi:hypothetical protein
MRYGTPEACRSFFVIFGGELDGPSREERSQFLGGLFGAELFGALRSHATTDATPAVRSSLSTAAMPAISACL